MADIGTITLRMAADTGQLTTDIAKAKEVVSSAAQDMADKTAKASTATDGYTLSVKQQREAALAMAASQAELMDKLQAMAAGAGKTQVEMLKLRAETLGMTDAAAPYIQRIEEATAKTHELSLANSGVTRELAVMGGEVARGNWTRLEGSMTVLANRTGLTQMAIQALAGGTGLLVGGFAIAAAAAAAFAVHEEHAAEAANLLQAQLDATGRLGEATGQQMKALVDQLAQMRGVSRDAAMGIVEAFTRTAAVSTSLIGDASKIVRDFAYVTGQSAPDAAKELAKALADPERGARSLDEQFNLLTASQMAQIEEMARHGETLKAQKLLLDAVNVAMGGLRDQSMTPLQTATDDLTKAWDRLMGSFARSEGLSMINTGITKLVDGVTWLVNHADDLAKITLLVGPFYAAGANVAAIVAGLKGNTGSVGGSWEPAPGSESGGGGSVKGIDDRAKALLRQYDALHSASYAEAEFYRQTNELDVMIQELSKDYDRNKDAIVSLQDKLTALYEQHAKHAPKVHEVAYAYSDLSRELDKASGEIDLQINQGAKLTDGQRFMAAEQEKLRAAVEHGRLSLVDYVALLSRAQSVADRKDAWQSLNDLMKQAADIYDANIKMGNAMLDTEQRQLDSLDKQIEKQQEATAELGLSKEQVEALRSAKLRAQATDDEEYARLVREAAIYAGPLHDAYVQYADDLEKGARKKRDLANAQDAYGAAKDALEAQKAWDEASKHISNGLYDAISHGGSDAFRKLLLDAKNWFARLVLQPIIQPIANFGASFMTGGSGIASAVSSGAGIANLLNGTSALGAAGSVFGSIGAGFTGAWGAGGGMLSTLNAAGSLIEGGSLMSGLGIGLGALGPIALGAVALASLFGKGGGPKTGGYFGAANGSGNAPGQFVGGEMSPDAVAQLQSTVGGLQTSYSSALAAIGGSGSATFGMGFSTDPKGTAPSMVETNVRGASGSLLLNQTNIGVGRDQAALTAEIQLQGQRAVLAALQASNLPQNIQAYLAKLNPLQASSKDIEAAMTLAQAVGSFDQALKGLGPDFANLRKQAVEDQDALATLAGGMQNLQSELSDYYNNYYTQAERNQLLQANMASAFAAQNVALPTTMAEYRALVQQFMDMGAAGNSTLAVLLKWEGAFAQLNPLVQDATTAVQGAVSQWNALASYATNNYQANLQATASLWGDLFTQARDGFTQLMKGINDQITKIRGEWTTDPTGQTQQSTLGAFNYAISQIMHGAGNATQLAKDLPQLSDSAIAYAKDSGMSGTDLRMLEAQIAASLTSVQRPLSILNHLDSVAMANSYWGSTGGSRARMPTFDELMYPQARTRDINRHLEAIHSELRKSNEKLDAVHVTARKQEGHTRETADALVRGKTRTPLITAPA